MGQIKTGFQKEGVAGTFACGWGYARVPLSANGYRVLVYWFPVRWTIFCNEGVFTMGNRELGKPSQLDCCPRCCHSGKWKYKAATSNLVFGHAGGILDHLYDGLRLLRMGVTIGLCQSTSTFAMIAGRTTNASLCPRPSKSNARSAPASVTHCSFLYSAQENPRTGLLPPARLPHPAVVAARLLPAGVTDGLSGAGFSLPG
jgi:hypothetical protein